MRVKRLSCTVRDKRGFRGDCMAVEKNGEYVLYSDYEKLKSQHEKLLIALQKHTLMGDIK